jgi:hypothetical protein
VIYLAFGVAVVTVAGFVYSLKRNGRKMMADLDRLDTDRTCPPADERTRFLKMMDEEFRR